MPKIERLRERVRNLNVRELNYRERYAIAPVATDGGQNRISFEPLNIEIIRVVDSEGTEHVQKIVPLSLEAEYLENLFEEVPVLREFLDRVGVTYEQLSYLLPKKGKDREDKDARGVIKVLRDILEWAVLLHMAWNPGRVKLLLLRDGLLRTKAIRKDIVPRISESFREAYERNDTLLAGIAKRSKVLNYLSVALVLERTFEKDYPCFCEVPRDLEAEAYNFDKTWIEGASFGRLHLAKLSSSKDSVILPVDIPEWLLHRRKEILEYLVGVSEISFPVVGYPYPLIKAHENAVLHGLEMEVLTEYVADGILSYFAGGELEKVLAHMTIGRKLTRGGLGE